MAALFTTGEPRIFSQFDLDDYPESAFIRARGIKSACAVPLATAHGIIGTLNLAQTGILSFTYPAVWGLVQLWTGAVSDRWGRKRLIASGMLVQGGALAAIALVRGFWPWAGMAVLLGAGTAIAIMASGQFVDGAKFPLQIVREAGLHVWASCAV